MMICSDDVDIMFVLISQRVHTDECNNSYNGLNMFSLLRQFTRLGRHFNLRFLIKKYF